MSAPLENEGVVYIFHGYSNGIHIDYVQRILPSNVLSQFSNVKLFGQSVYGNIDHDSNGYPGDKSELLFSLKCLTVQIFFLDLMIGIPGLDAIAIMYTRAVVKLHANLTVLSQRVERNRCKILNYGEACAELQLCFHYTGVGTPNNIS